MKLLIIGNGFVGQSVGYTFAGQDILIWDINQNRRDDIGGGVDAVFICVPTPQLETGEADWSIVKQYVEEFKHHPLVIVKSSVPPTAVKKLCAIKPDLVIIPEFLRERHWKEDTATGNNFKVVGVYGIDTFDKVVELYNKSCFKHSPPFYTTPETAMAYKYYANAFLAMKVVFNHEFIQWFEKIENSPVELLELISKDSRLGNSHLEAPGFHGWGYSGSCFPKDTSAIYMDANGKLPLIGKVIEQNQQLRTIL